MEGEGKRDCSAVANTSGSLVGMLAGKPEKLGRRGTRTNSLKSMHKNARLCRKGQSSLGRSPKAGFPVFSASDEALPTALSLWYPGGDTEQSECVEAYYGQQGFRSKQRGLNDKYPLALSGLI